MSTVLQLLGVLLFVGAWLLVSRWASERTFAWLVFGTTFVVAVASACFGTVQP